LADAIKAKFDVQPEMIEGSGGVFEVKADGKLIFSKKQTGRFPEHQEIFDSLGAKAKA